MAAAGATSRIATNSSSLQRPIHRFLPELRAQALQEGFDAAFNDRARILALQAPQIAEADQQQAERLALTETLADPCIHLLTVPDAGGGVREQRPALGLPFLVQQTDFVA